MNETEVIETTGREIVATNGHAEPLALIQGSPTEVVTRATEMANELRQVINKQHLYADIQGKKHVTVEGWTTLGALVGVFPVVAWSRAYVDEKGQAGWEARVEVCTASGQTIGAAEAQCTRSERMWDKRDDYALRSMAQTRATSKAMRLPLSWIMALAGFEVTPAEEMPREAPQARSAPAKAEKAPPRAPDAASKVWALLYKNFDRATQREEMLDFVQQKYPHIVAGEGDRRRVSFNILEDGELETFAADLEAMAN